RRVQILGLVIAQHPAPEAYHPAAAVADGEGDAVTEAVVALAAVRVFHHQAGLDQPFFLAAVRGQASHQAIPAWWGEADVVELGDVAGQAALLQVVHRPLALGMLTQLLTIVGGRVLQYRIQRAVLARGARAASVTPFLPWNLHAGLACQL